MFALLAKIKIWEVNANFGKDSLKELQRTLKIFVKDLHKGHLRYPENPLKKSLKNLWKYEKKKQKKQKKNKLYFLFINDIITIFYMLPVKWTR